MKTSKLSVIVSAMVFIFMAGNVLADSGNWAVDASGNWSDAANWSSNPTVPGTAAGDSIGLNNNIAGARVVTVDSASRTNGTLNIGDSNNTHSFTLAASGGGTLTFDNSGSGAALNETGSIADTNTVPLILADNLTATVAGSLIISSIISETGGAKSLTKAGTGSLTLSGNNSYSGGTTFSAGTIYATHANALGSGTLTFTASRSLYAAYGFYPTYPNSVQVNNGVTASFNPGQNQYWGMSFSGELTGSGTVSLTSANAANTLPNLGFLNTNNTFTGKITINNTAAAGTFRINSLPDSTNPIQISNGIFEFGSGTAAPYVFNARQVQLIGTTSGATINNNASSTNTVAFYKDLAIVGTGAKTFILGGSNTGANTFAGNITNGVGSVISLEKSGTGKWILSGTNTYTGGTYCNTGSGTLVFQGTQSAPAGRTITLNQLSSSTSAVRLLADGEGTNTFAATIAFDNRNAGAPGLGFLVGNTSSGNGGTGGGTTTNATIAVNKFSYVVNQGAAGGQDGPGTLSINNGYTFQIGAVQFAAGANLVAGWQCQLNPAGGSVVVTGNVQQDNGNTSTSKSVIFVLGGTSTGNIISGNIKDAADIGTNTNAVPLTVTKSGTSTWTLSGNNTYSGPTTVSAGTLVLAASTCLADTNLLSIATGAKVQLNDGVKEVVGSLKINSVTQSIGKWGAAGNANATYTNAVFTGNGLLYVGIPVPASGTIIQLR
jgi:fibronectin-binding autotransporter adhesin